MNTNRIRISIHVCSRGVGVKTHPNMMTFAYHSDSKEARELKLIRDASSQFCFSLKLVISVFKYVNCGTFSYFFSETVPSIHNS